jgi:hypothetical protein
MATSQTSAKRNSCNNAKWVGFGPSSKTWPRCASHSVQGTALRLIPKLQSVVSRTFSFAMGAQKLGQPVPDSNLVSELNNALLQTDAAIQTLVVQIEVFAGKRSFRAFFTSYPELQWS